jgi:Ca2+-transporting ATPase
MPTMPTKVWLQSSDQVLHQLQTDPEKGLTSAEANRRLQSYGPNILELKKPTPLILLFLRQFFSSLMGVLAIASALAFFFQEWLEGIAILVVILINALIGFFMELQAVRSMEALRKLTQSYSNVIRNGTLQSVETADLVPGDLIYLEAGSLVPADARIVEETNLGVKEAALTGESTQVSKGVEALEGEIGLPDRTNMLFKGTIITRGNAKAVVTATGKKTELGHITHLAQEAVKSATPLEKKLGRLSQKLIWLTLALTIAILVIGVLQGKDVYLMIKTAIALGIASIPEGLPIVATIALARGMLRLADHQVVVKKLSAVETLGETGVIFTDKTGTLTENKLSVDVLLFDFGQTDIYFETGKIKFEEAAEQEDANTFAFQQIRLVGALCNNASESVGDPLEVALLEFAESNGQSLEELREHYARIKEIPFDSDTKMMGTLHKNGHRPDFLVCIKGAVEVVLEESDYVLTEQGRKPLNKRQEWIDKADHLAARGLRILALAYSEIDEPEDAFFHNVTLIGLIGFVDPARREVLPAIQTCKEAGIRVVMVTGDHPETARNIALKTGLVEDPQAIAIHGNQFNDLALLDEEERKKVLASNIFARFSPAQKLDLITMYQDRHHTVAMTGDGINDVPALKKSDIGIAMGQRGTEAAKEVADLILKDDAFTSIVTAVKQGRGIFQNIRHFVVYLLSCNLSEILVVAFAAFTNLGVPLLPLQILFLNMVTDVFPALALGMNRESDQVMKEPPRPSREPIITKSMWKSIVGYAVGMTISVIWVSLYATYSLQTTSAIANNLTFYTLILAQLWHVFNLPKREQSFFNNEITRNVYIWLALATCVLITVLAYRIPVVSEVMDLQPVSWRELWIVLPASFIPVFIIQVLKKLRIIN